MTFVIGRGEAVEDGPRCHLGAYRALDGSSSAPLYVDLDRPHAALVVGKRGYGKSYTLGVLAEGLARADGTAPVLVDTMGAFPRMAAGSSGEPVPTEVVGDPTVAPAALDPRAWCEMLGLTPESGAGSLVWRGAQRESAVPAMCEHVRAATRRGRARSTPSGLGCRIRRHDPTVRLPWRPPPRPESPPF